MTAANWTEVRLYKLVYGLASDVLADDARSASATPLLPEGKAEPDAEKLSYEVAGRLHLAEVDETVRAAVGDAVARRTPRW